MATEHRLDRISVWSVARVALLFYLTVGALIMAGISVAVYVASELGVITNFERFMQDVGFGHFRVLTGQFVLGAFIIAGAVISLWVVLTIAAAALYNVIATPWGGVRVTLTPVADEAPLTDEPLPTAFGNGKEKHTVSAAGNGSANGKRERDPPRGREGSLPRQRVRLGYTDAGFAGKASDSGGPNPSSSLRRA